MNTSRRFPNILCVGAAGLVLSLGYWARTGLTSYVSLYNYVSVFALAAILFILPDFLCSCWPAEGKWYRTCEFYTVVLIVLLAVSGIVLSNYSTWVGYIALPIGFALIFWETLQSIRHEKILTMVAGIAFMAFMTLLFYSQACHSLLFPEKILLGKAHIDVLFHSSMSNMFSALGFASTGLNGSPYIPYHWGSHALFAGLKNWSGLGTLLFYNLAYPAIFLPLFFKSLFNFTNRMFVYKGMGCLHDGFAFSLLIVLYSLPIARFQSAMPIGSESYCLALLFTLLYAAILISYVSSSDKKISSFYCFSLIAILLITFFKISNGFVCFFALSYLCFRTLRKIKSLVLVLGSGFLLALFVLLVIFPIGPYAIPHSLLSRFRSFWELSDGFIIYFLGIFIAIVAVLKNESLTNLKEWAQLVKSKKYVDLEILFVMTLAGVMGGIFTSAHSSDVYYFCTVQLFISIPYLIFFAQRSFDRFRAPKKYKTAFLYSVILLAIVSRPDVVKGVGGPVFVGSAAGEMEGSIAEIVHEKQEVARLTRDQRLLSDFMTELFNLEKIDARKSKCIYIPQTEKWYYESQKYRPYGSAMVAPAIAGIALVGGIQESVLKTNVADAIGYGFYLYKNSGQAKVASIDDAIKSAERMGYSELLQYQALNGKLARQRFNLRIKAESPAKFQ